MLLASLTLLVLFLLLAGTAPRLSAQDLNIYMTASSEVVGPGDRTTYMLVATNTSAVELTDVSVDVQLPDHINNFAAPPGMNCGTNCNANEVATWTIGTLAPGESETVFYQVQIAGTAPAGTIMSSATASATGTSNASASLDVEIDTSPLVRLSLAPGVSPVVTEEKFTYTLTFSNTGSTSSSNAVLSMPVPDGASFVSATDGGAASNGTVTWNLSTLGPGAGGQVRVTVMPDASLGNGQVLRAVAELNPNVATEPVARSSAMRPVRETEPLQLEYGVSQTAVEPGGQITYTLTAANTSAMDLTDVEARVLLPGFIDNFAPPPGMNCGTNCNANEAAVWAVGTLAPGESQTVTFEPTVSSSAPRGNSMRSIVVATATGSGEVILERDVLVGSADTPLPVELALFEATLDGADVLLSWQTASETNNAGFEVQLKRSAEGAFARHGFVEGHGTTAEVQQYSYRIADLAPGHYAFRLKQVDLDGASSYSSEVEVQVLLAEPYVLSATYPNPFSYRTQFTLAARQAQHVELSVYNVLGQRVALVHEGALEANEAQRFTLGVQGLPNGVYFLRVKGEHFEETRRIVVMK